MLPFLILQVKLRWPEDVNFGESVFKLSLNDERIWRYTCKIDFWEKLKPVGRGSNSKKVLDLMHLAVSVCCQQCPGAAA